MHPAQRLARARSGVREAGHLADGAAVGEAEAEDESARRDAHPP
jgi:hypothetical protein